MAERNGLLNRRRGQTLPRVRIPLSPPVKNFAPRQRRFFYGGERDSPEAVKRLRGGGSPRRNPHSGVAAVAFAPAFPPPRVAFALRALALRRR